MISKNSILGNLKSLDNCYRKAKSQKEALFYSKLAILELCGWVEETMDDIVMRCAIRHLKERNNRKYCKDNIVKKTYGFDYERNFRFMLIRLLGLVNVERIERQVDARKRSGLEGALGSLKAVRDAEAHTHLKGTTRRLNAPSFTITQFKPLYEGLVEFDMKIRRRRY